MRLNVAIEVIGNQVVVAMVHDAIDESAECICVTEHAVLDGVEHILKVGVELELGVEVGVAEILDIFREVAKQEDVLLANLSCDLDVRPVAGSDDQTAVQDELHVGSTGSFGSRSGNVLADVAGGNDDLGLGYIVIFEEDDLEEVSDVGIVVDNTAYLVDEVDDL